MKVSYIALEAINTDHILLIMKVPMSLPFDSIVNACPLVYFYLCWYNMGIPTYSVAPIHMFSMSVSHRDNALTYMDI